MILLQTLGSTDSKRPLPAPRVYMPVIIVWSGLTLAKDAGLERGARTAGWVMVLTGMVLGPFGARLVNFFNGVANRYGAAPAQATTATPANSFQPTPA